MSLRKLLITSFRPWLAYHQSNSSDDLLELVEGLKIPNIELIFLRKLVVDTTLASEQVIAAIAQHQPDVILCCGMAESRQILTLESQAFYGEKHFQTQLNLEKLCKELTQTSISHDAGKFICEGLYFHVLAYLQQKRMKNPAVFIHVPRLNKINQDSILKDFLKIMRYLGEDLGNYLQ